MTSISFNMFPYCSMFGSLWWSETLGGGCTGGHIKDTATPGSALKQRGRQPERLLGQNQTLTVNIVILLAPFETGL